MNNLKLFILLLRPHQWLKNLMLFFPAFLGGEFLRPGVISKGYAPFVVFSCAASAGYIVNDLIDREVDRLHPVKSSRPLPSGRIAVRYAYGMAVLLVTLSLTSAYILNPRFFLFIAFYIAISISYSFYFKKVPLVDLFCIASGFVLRLYAGGVVFSILISEWLFLSVFLLSLFLSAGKRLSEKNTLLSEASLHRTVLSEYPEGFLEGVLYMSGGAVLVTYTMYTLTHKTLLYTVPLCCFGLLRYSLRVKSGGGGDPTDALLHDRQLLFTGMLWATLVCWSIYV